MCVSPTRYCKWISVGVFLCVSLDKVPPMNVSVPLYVCLLHGTVCGCCCLSLYAHLFYKVQCVDVCLCVCMFFSYKVPSMDFFVSVCVSSTRYSLKTSVCLLSVCMILSVDISFSLCVCLPSARQSVKICAHLQLRMSFSHKAACRHLSFCLLSSCGFALTACRTQNRMQDCYSLLKRDHWHCSSLSVQPPGVVHPIMLSPLTADTCIFRIPNRCKRFQGQHTFSFIGPSIWNHLPFSVRHAQTLSAFKSQLKTHLFFYLLLLLI